MSWVATWFIFELIGVEAPPDLNEPQAFKNVPLQMMIDKTSTFRCTIHKNLHHIQVFDVRYEWQGGSGSGYPFTTSTKIFRFNRFRFQLRLPLPHPWLQHYQMRCAAFYPRKTSKRQRLLGLRPNFCQISIVRP